MCSIAHHSHKSRTIISGRAKIKFVYMPTTFTPITSLVTVKAGLYTMLLASTITHLTMMFWQIVLRLTSLVRFPPRLEVPARVSQTIKVSTVVLHGILPWCVRLTSCFLAYKREWVAFLHQQLISTGQVSDVYSVVWSILVWWMYLAMFLITIVQLQT